MSDPKWPWYLPGWHDDIYAIGMIGLNFCKLETSFRHLFAVATGMSGAQVEAFFQRLQNDARLKVFEQLYTQRADIPELHKSFLTHFAKGYKICAGNRNETMHSSFGGQFQSESANKAGIVLSKYNNTSGKEILCPLSLSDLRRIADEIHDYSMFGFALRSDIDGVLRAVSSGNPKTVVPRPSLDKPPVPQSLVWQSLPNARLRQPPPALSQE